MNRFTLGLLLGCLSGGITYALTADTTPAVVVGAIAAVLTWLGLATFLLADD
ncbi:hypothetical protein [Streptomyces chryseus]|uniref:Uncharacterized protein n=1 Tax=Streptomyces chryseus TaxID=68186 RepID=A0ABQ3DGW6_9ACTN|nr:hypothetical protein [Streptomyces chryseus]GHA94150.1 hypothetical protein GCM10010346_16110 [Streptomyces chryseus]